MKDIIDEIIKKQKNVKIDVYQLERKVKEQLEANYRGLFYKDFASILLDLENEKVIERTKTSKPYSRDTRIQTRYKKIKEEIENESMLKNEILTSYHIKMKMGSYLKNLAKYELEKEKLRSISNFLGNQTHNKALISVNERSFELFDDEKFLSSDSGRKLISNIGLKFEDLHCFETFEPFFYYGLSKNSAENILIVENKDTFFSLKKLFLEGNKSWFGIPFEMLVYGEGNKITKSVEHFNELNVPMDTTIYYFGDFDPEGIDIFYRLQKISGRNIKLWKPFYMEMWKRKKDTKIDDNKKQKWNRVAIQSFLFCFEESTQKEMEKYLKERKYIPQEAVNLEVLRSLSDGTT